MTSHQHAGVDRPSRSGGRRRRLARLPPALYRVGLGPVFGRRLLLLRHAGRDSGPDRRVALEVVAHDRGEGTWILASCHGPEAAWYRALRTRPKTTIQFGNRHYAVTAHFPSAEEGGEILARCAPARPRAARRLCASAGVDIADGGPDPYRRAGRRIPFVRLDAAPGQCVR
ncbi:nitroreductase family deazaflavin-dependent oxidoreductase [Streptomyces californicus]|uniref:nitroreductase family deazaflavin-dependent oxidoreductase n=1 Tax=Streptomyces californicus TaxID=67351 RepID=UPI0033CFA812